MRVFVLGGTGMAGHVISQYLLEKNHDVTVLSRRKSIFEKNVILDATDFEGLKEHITNFKYDFIINAVGLLNEEAEVNKSKAVLINSYLPHFLSDIIKDSKTKLFQISTDCVFSGKTGDYSESSFRDGAKFYDRSKALGEIENNKDLTFRTSIIGPDINNNGIGLFNWFMKQTTDIDGYKNAIWTGVSTITLAKAMERVMNTNVTLTGVYNLVNNKKISKFDLLGLFNKYFKNDETNININDKVYVNKSLVNNRSDFDFNVPSYEDMIIEMKEWVIRHKELYPHYFGEI